MILDNIKEIAYQADYFTTLDLLQAYPTLDTDHFWEEKWNKQYPNQCYVPFFTNQDSFLIMERKNFVLIFYSNGCPECCISGLYKNILYEDDGTLQEKFETYSQGFEDFEYIPLHVKKQFVVIQYEHNILF